MSELLPDLGAPKDQRKLTPEEEELQDHKIQHPGQLMDLMTETVEEEWKIRSEDRRQATQKGKAYRTRDDWAKFGLGEVVGNATPRIWKNMVRAALSGMRKTINHSQSNGDWQVMDFEGDIMRDRAGLEQILIGARWVDMNNENDLQYAGGHPVSLNVNVQGAGVPQEVLEALAAQSGGDAELKAALATLIDLLAKREAREASDPPDIDFPGAAGDLPPAG